jgi:CRP/FNR family cyclic AMP-dependent transcriptional regulator
MAVEQPDGTRLVEERLTQQEMAHRLGCSREMVSRVLKDLVRGGYIDQRGARLGLTRPLPARW